MHLAPASSDPQLVKGDILQYCKDLIASIENNHALVEQSFHSALQGIAKLKIHTLQPGGFVYWKRHLKKDSLQPHWKGPYQSRTCCLLTLYKSCSQSTHFPSDVRDELQKWSFLTPRDKRAAEVGRPDC